MLPGQVDVAAERRAALQSQHGAQHSEDGVHRAAFLQSLLQRLEVNTARYEVGQQQEEVKGVETWERENRRVCPS